MGIPSSRRTRDRASRGSVDVFSAFERVSAFRRRRSASHSRARSKKLSGFGGSPGSWGPSARSLSSAPSVAAPQRSSTTFRGSARRRPKTPTNGTPPTFRTSRAISLRSHIYARGPCAAAPPETPLRARTRRAGAGERLGSETAGRGLSCRSPPSRSCRAELVDLGLPGGVVDPTLSPGRPPGQKALRGVLAPPRLAPLRIPANWYLRTPRAG